MGKHLVNCRQTVDSFIIETSLCPAAVWPVLVVFALGVVVELRGAEGTVDPRGTVSLVVWLVAAVWAGGLGLFTSAWLGVGGDKDDSLVDDKLLNVPPGADVRSLVTEEVDVPAKERTQWKPRGTVRTPSGKGC